MEKIYMNDRQSNQQRKNQRRKANTSVIMSFVLAFVAIISLVAYGFGSISYAIPDAAEAVRVQSFKITEQKYYVSTLRNLNNEAMQIPVSYATINGVKTLVLCVESDVDVRTNQDYNQADKVTDTGLNYLLNILYSKKVVNASGAEADSDLADLLKQVTVWLYQNEVGAYNNTNKLANGGKELLLAEKTFVNRTTSSMVGNTSQPLVDAYQINGMTLRNLYLEAVKVRNGQSDSYSKFEVKGVAPTEGFKLSEDGKYYTSGLVTVTKTGNEVGATFKGYKIDLSHTPEGTVAIKEDGTIYTEDELDNLTAEGTKFYLRIPADKVNEQTSEISVGIKAAVTRPTAYYYVLTNSQKMAYVYDNTEIVDQPLAIPFDYSPDVPDTFFGAAQTIYFIGLVILLAGVGIIYANVKPAKVNQ